MKSDSPLQRGKACLCCRKRKMRCDGVKPVCGQCIKANRDSECQYHEKKQVSRTQLLQQKVAKLEARLRELESEQSDSGTISSPTPSTPSSSSSDPSVSISDSADPSVSGSPFIPPSTDWDTGLFDDNLFPGYNPSTFFPDSSSPSDFASTSSLSSKNSTRSSSISLDWWENADTFCANKQYLVDVFLTHRHQCAFDVHIERFQESLHAPREKQPHPALMDAIYLMGCNFSRESTHTNLEPYFLKHTLCGISEALQHNDRVVDVLRASSLLAVYFFGRGSILEGYYHSSIAARLAISLGLHQIKSDDMFQFFPSLGFNTPPPPTSKSSVQLPPPRDAIESHERIAAFWQVFSIDRAWSVATGLPAALPDDDHPQAAIETVWPTPLSTYNTMMNDNSTLMQYDIVSSYPPLRAKAVAMFERTFRMSSTPVKGDAFWSEHHTLATTLVHFSNFLPAIGLSNAQPLTRSSVDLLTIHTMIYVSTILLYRDHLDNNEFYQRCLVAANAVTSLILELGHDDYDYLDPISSTCWSYVADVYVRAMRMAHVQTDVQFLSSQLEIMVIAMKRISKVFPIAGIHASKVERDRVFGNSIVTSS
ncbi:hypothetical protein ABKN59_011044 [Abortiporus biennis]